jgi:hypothetical protein
MGTYTSFWQHHTDKKLTQVRVTPFGWDDHAYFVREEAKPSAKKFKVVEEKRIAGDEGSKQVVEAFFSFRAQVALSADQPHYLRRRLAAPGFAVRC